MFLLENVSFRYPKNKEVTLRGISFQVQDGEIFGLLGPSGVGKSTTLKLLIRLLTGYEGKISYRGQDLNQYDKEFYQDIGVGFEMPVHFSKLTAAENLDFFKRLYQSPADTDELLKQVGLYEDKDKPVSQFSKGMKVRLNFVRALLNNPKMLFLDEPTNGLDPRNARIVKDMVREFRKSGGTVLLTTHLMSDVDELCDRVAFMSQGKIAEIDSPKNLKLKHGQRQAALEFEEDGAVKQESFDLDALGQSDRFLEIIQNRKIITMHSKETTLEDIFIKVTGVSMDE